MAKKSFGMMSNKEVNQMHKKMAPMRKSDLSKADMHKPKASANQGGNNSMGKRGHNSLID